MSAGRVLVTMGDPNGIGPEVLLKAVSQLEPGLLSRLQVVADPHYLEALSRDLGLPVPSIDYLEVEAGPYPPAWGRVTTQAGAVARACLEKAMEALSSGRGEALVTAPIHKKAARLAGFDFPGQTEFVSSYFPRAVSAMGFLSTPLKLVLATVHVPLSQVPALLTTDRILACSDLLRETLIRLGISSPRIAICGLNPHASESGLFGDEEEEVIVPALRVLAGRYEEGAFSGPHPADSLFTHKGLRDCDGVVAMYHDQGLIPFKLLAFESGVNATLGLPVVRTSPAHGTAFDIAGQGIADPSSMRAALEWGFRLTDA